VCSSDLVTSAGKKVFPVEVETRLQALAGIREYCVVGLPARQGQGEEVAVVVVPEPGAEPKAIQARIEKLNQELPSHQRIARVEFRKEELPKTTTLKVQRGKLRAYYLGASGDGVRARLAAAEGAAPVAGEKGELFAEVAKAVAETAGVRPEDVHLDQKLQLDLGLDSIGRVDLIGKLELRLNVSLSDEAMRGLRTVGHGVAIVAAAGSGARKSRRAAPKLAERVWRHGAWDPEKALHPSLSKTLLQGAMKTTEKVFFNTYLSITAYGLEHVPAGRPFILASNHCSHLDTAAIRAVLGRHASAIHVMGAKDYFFDTRLKSWFFSTVFNVLPFDREEHTLDGLGLCRAVLEGGKSLLIFPEGTRSVTGRLLPFKPGIGILALELDYPVLPVFVDGTYESLPKGHRVPRPSRVEVRFGPALDFTELRQRKAQEAAKEPKAGKEHESERRGRREAGTLGLYRAAAELIHAEVEKLSQAP
jgi:long-chain acyl-CoA synthetase